MPIPDTGRLVPVSEMLVAVAEAMKMRGGRRGLFRLITELQPRPVSDFRTTSDWWRDLILVPDVGPKQLKKVFDQVEVRA